MQNSSCETLTVAASGGTAASTPTTLAKAGPVPLRVAVNNVGVALCLLAFTTTDLSPTPSTAVYRLPATRDVVFILAPRQSLYALAVGNGGLLSTTISEALPRD